MLWAHLLASVISRDVYLACFRAVIVWARERKDLLVSLNPPESEATKVGGSPCEIDMTGLSLLPSENFNEFFKILVKHPLGYGALRPLLLIHALPGYAMWQKEIGVDPTESDWQTLGQAVIETFDHQSEVSTDVRWLKLMQKMAVGRIFFGEAFDERVDEYIHYPIQGDLRQVRPSIRATEMSLRRIPTSTWVAQYWKQLLEETSCSDGSSESEYLETAPPVLPPVPI